MAELVPDEDIKEAVGKAERLVREWYKNEPIAEEEFPLFVALHQEILRHLLTEQREARRDGC